MRWRTLVVMLGICMSLLSLLAGGTWAAVGEADSGPYNDVQRTGVLLTSPDGITWTEHPWPFGRHTPRFTFGGGRFLATADDGVFAVGYGKGTFIASGPGGVIFTGQVCGGAFPDVAAGQVISGFPDGSFRPGAPVTRAEAATVLANMLER